MLRELYREPKGGPSPSWEDLPASLRALMKRRENLGLNEKTNNVSRAACGTQWHILWSDRATSDIIGQCAV